jgi:hypothetical protein
MPSHNPAAMAGLARNVHIHYRNDLRDRRVCSSYTGFFACRRRKTPGAAQATTQPRSKKAGFRAVALPKENPDE